MRRDLFRGEIPRHLANRNLVLVESEMHLRSVPVCSSVSKLRIIGIYRRHPEERRGSDASRRMATGVDRASRHPSRRAPTRVPQDAVCEWN
jgi:hypothetical protein